MIWFLVAVLFSIGLLWCALLRWRGLLVAVLSVFGYLMVYGYATIGLFLPAEFYLLAVYGEHHVWVEDGEEPRSIWLREVPEEWRKALEDQQGQPVRIRQHEEEGEEALNKTASKFLQYLTDDLTDWRVVDEYRMQKG